MLFPSNKTVFNQNHGKLVISVHVDSDPEYPYERDGTGLYVKHIPVHPQGYLTSAHTGILFGKGS